MSVPASPNENEFRHQILPSSTILSLPKQPIVRAVLSLNSTKHDVYRYDGATNHQRRAECQKGPREKTFCTNDRMSNNGTSLPTSVVILSPASQHFVSHARVTIAPWIMGTFADLFLQGILAAQTTAYFTLYENRNLSSIRRPNLSWLVIFL
ncbi:1455_t:CDS:2, partial [Acaulospora colombiana]